jgi:precorrin-6B methylase 2
MDINEKTWNFIREHAEDDIRKLALLGSKDREVDLKRALQQIAGQQTARRKLPSWAGVDGIVYPPHLNMEQCSSEQTARYKATLVAGGGNRYMDLTGGLGVDFYWMSQNFEQRYYIEQNKELCSLAEHNFQTLGLDCSVCCETAATALTGISHADVIFLDPARRNEQGGRTYDIKDCTPNILEMLPQLMEKADKVILKLSPMLDWRKAVEDLNYVREVHIVSVDNECKELLLVLTRSENPFRLVCVNNDSVFGVSMPPGSQPVPIRQPSAIDSQLSALNPLPSYLYEPNASIMKAGCFTELEQQFSVAPISANSHLFLSSVEMRDFPGRGFQILGISSMNKHALKEALAGTDRANIAVRNFPLSAEQLRKRLKLKDGGDCYIFATTQADGEHRLYICCKIG